MGRFRDRPKNTRVQAMKVTAVQNTGILQVGDAQHINPFFREFSVGGSRGAASFVTLARHLHSNTRLNYNNQLDDQFADFNMNEDDAFYRQLIGEIEDAASD
ncbi:hypothetical protein [Effusibacillus lacus]|uniref:Uncharacterized protein n=1 Tax=Effusibacillus lacus TaxID=1348429 RepID=A0A292YHD1_9BACL|nr:hypothetical protein [Effusibacillus lacus]TCS72291.1 spore germination protein GerPA/GerPF [Effusibacillus lacus]GAX90237.1 hypothetical protein EFBL_1863 [Effusibacillus lacus]